VRWWWLPLLYSGRDEAARGGERWLQRFGCRYVVAMVVREEASRCCCNGEEAGTVLPWWCKGELMEVLVARGGRKTCCRQGWRLLLPTW